MTVNRRYDRHRRAYLPRLWPMALCAAVLGGAGGKALSPVLAAWSPVPALAVYLVIFSALGYLIVRVRVSIWMRRHPWAPCEHCGPMLYITFKTEQQREVARWQ